jgi:hypothetical protein
MNHYTAVLNSHRNSAIQIHLMIKGLASIKIMCHVMTGDCQVEREEDVIHS